MPKHSPKYPLLAIDTASRRTWVGLKLGPDQLHSKSEEQDPSKSLFRLVESVLSGAGIGLAQLASMAFCAGPGSMLGARTASMAIRTWKGIAIAGANDLFTYNSLQIGALIASNALGADSEGVVVTDARRSSWNALPFPSGARAPLALMTNEELENQTHDLVTFTEFPVWTKTTAILIKLNYDPTPFFKDETFLTILTPTDQANPLTVRSNEYLKWEAKIHSAPIL